MAVEIAPIKGLIELQDDFTSGLGLAEAALSNFTKENQESLKAVAGAAGLVTAAIGAVAAATLALGARGADVNDLRATIVEFAGGAKEADEAMAALRAGTLGTVDNFTLAKEAAHLLSADVKLTAGDFNTLASAASILANRGLGSTEEQLKLVSEAMITGRTKALALATGVIEVGDAEENYAKTLGVTKDQLSETGKVEAHRIEVMRILSEAVKNAGAQERDFGEQLQALQVGFQNYLDNVASAIAASPVFTAGMNAIADALDKAFGENNQAFIEDTVHAIEQAAIVAIDFAQGAITMAKVVESAWYVVKTAVLAVETVVVGVADAIAEAMTPIAQLGAKLHIVSPEALAEVEDARTVLRGMTADLAAQTAEAASSVVGHTALDDTLDMMSDTLEGVQSAMRGATTATVENNEVSTIAEANAKKMAATQEELNKRMIDQTKITEAVIKSTKELDAIWQDYFAAVAAASGTSGDAQRAQIEATFSKQVAALEAMDPLFKEKYNAYRQTADQALGEIGSSWDELRDQSIEGLMETAEAARRDYDKMLYSGLHFTREVLDVQLAKWREAQDAVRGYGAEAVAANEKAAAAAKKVTDELEAQKKAAEAAKAANRAAGGSAEFNRANINDDLLRPWGVNVANIEPWLKANYSLEDAIAFFKKFGPYTKGFPQGPGPRMTGYAQGGLVDISVGEQGPETVRVPLGSIVYPGKGMAPGGGAGGMNVVNNFYVNGTGTQVAQQIKEILFRELQTRRQF